MKTFRWNHEKNEQLKIDRAISFEEMVLALEAEGLLDILCHPNAANYPNQRILVICFREYVYLVPFVEETDYYFLKTINPAGKPPESICAEAATNEKNRQIRKRT